MSGLDSLTTMFERVSLQPKIEIDEKEQEKEQEQDPKKVYEILGGKVTVSHDGKVQVIKPINKELLFGLCDLARNRRTGEPAVVQRVFEVLLKLFMEPRLSNPLVLRSDAQTRDSFIISLMELGVYAMLPFAKKTQDMLHDALLRGWEEDQATVVLVLGAGTGFSPTQLANLLPKSTTFVLVDKEDIKHKFEGDNPQFSRVQADYNDGRTLLKLIDGVPRCIVYLPCLPPSYHYGIKDQLQASTLTKLKNAVGDENFRVLITGHAGYTDHLKHTNCVQGKWGQPKKNNRIVVDRVKCPRRLIELQYTKLFDKRYVEVPQCGATRKKDECGMWLRTTVHVPKANSEPDDGTAVMPSDEDESDVESDSSDDEFSD